MATIKYIGSKEQGHTTFTKLTGIVWFPGNENPVKEEHAKVLLRHPDAFELVPEKKTASTSKPEGAGDAGTTLTPGAQVGEATATAPAKPARKAAAKKTAVRKAKAKA